MYVCMYVSIRKLVNVQFTETTSVYHSVDYIKARVPIMATRESSSESSRALSRERRRAKRLRETEEERQTRLHRSREAYKRRRESETAEQRQRRLIRRRKRTAMKPLSRERSESLR